MNIIHNHELWLLKLLKCILLIVLVIVFFWVFSFESDQRRKMIYLILRDNIFAINNFVDKNKFSPGDLTLNGIEGINNLDAWGRGFLYKKCANSGYVIYSLGKNGVDECGRGDDIVAPSDKEKNPSCSCIE